MNETVETTPQDGNEQPRKRGVLPIVLGVLLIAGVGGGAAYFVNSAGNAAEAKAAEEIKSLKAVTVMDANRKHVGSLNTVTVNNDAEKFNRVMELTPALTYLQILDLSGAPVTKEQLATFSGLTKLTTLQLNKTVTSDEDVRHFFGMNQLESIYLAGTKLTNKGLGDVAQLASLTILDVSNNDLTELQPLTKLPKLTHLLIYQDTPFTDANIEELAAMPSLRRLTINPGQMTEEQASKLRKAKSVLSIDNPNIQ